MAVVSVLRSVGNIVSCRNLEWRQSSSGRARLLEKVILSSDGNFLAQIVRETQIVPFLLQLQDLPMKEEEGEE